jgi:hypothetical protein
MRFHIFRDGILKKICIKRRLQAVCLWYLLSLTVSARKHTLTFASGLSGKKKSRFSGFLRNNRGICEYTLENLSKKEAKRYAGLLKTGKKVSPLNVLLLFDTTIQGRSSLKSENVQRFSHGKGYVIGHQWTNILMILNGAALIPLPPIPFWSKRYCRKKGLEYKTEHVRVTEYIKELNLYDYIGWHIEENVIVLTDSGYDDKKIQKTVLEKGWHFISALKISRGVRPEQKGSGWDRAGNFFRNHRRIGWQTVRILTEGGKRRRKEFRVRHADVFLKGVGKVRAVCSEFKKRREGGRKHFACSDLKMTAREILITYRMRRKTEIFHKEVKMHLGFEDAAAKHFDSVVSHVCMVYCAYILLHSDLPGISGESETPEKQKKVEMILQSREIAAQIHEITKIGGPVNLKNKLKSALMEI